MTIRVDASEVSHQAANRSHWSNPVGDLDDKLNELAERLAADPFVVPKLDVEGRANVGTLCFGFLSYTLAVDTHNLGATNVSIIRLNCTAPAKLTGVVAPSPVAFKLLFIRNTGAANATLPHDDANSGEGNRFYCPNGVNFVLLPDEGCTLVYDTVDQRWGIMDRT